MRILIATVTAGAGHVQAAAALEEAWKAMRPRDSVQRLDVLDFAPKLYRKVYVEGYIKLVEHAPDLWALVFKKTDNPALMRKLSRFRRTLGRFTTGRFARHLSTTRPDAVLCTHFMPLEILGAVRRQRKGSSKPPFVASVVTDFEAHALWMDPDADLYCVAQEETKAGLVARGVPSDRVVATGIPVAAKFSQPIEVQSVRKRNGWRDDLPMVLVLSGGFGMGPVREVLEQLDRASGDFQVVVVCGKNEELRRELATRNPRRPTHVLGFVTNMHELMAASTLILTKPGGLTCSEALALGKPLVLLNPIPGQEAANSDFLLEHGAAVKVNRLEELPFRIEKLLAPGRLQSVAAAARQIGRPQAAPDVCAEVLRRLKSRQD
jgi:processive 1,2-diacylglycerol beta-glucosyltransferase